MNKVSASTESISFTIPGTNQEFHYDLDTNQYPYYVGTMKANSSTEFAIELIFSNQPFYYEGIQKDYCQVPGYMDTYCYGWLRKRSGSTTKFVYIAYDVETNHIIRTNLNSPSDYSNDLISLYNYSDFINNVPSYYEMTNGYPYLDGPVGWILSNNLETSGGTTVLTTDYINSISGPTAEYNISDGTEIGKKLTFTFKGFDSESYAKITNLSSGEVINVSDLSDHTSYVIDNISYDSVYYIEVYNKEELIYVDTIDINQELRLAKKPYIDLTLDKERLISWLDFYNLKENYHVYYSKNNGSFTEVQLEENKNHIRVGFNNDQEELHNKNYTIRGQITDENGNILYDRGYNIVFFKNQPYFTFNTSYSIDSGCNNLTITYHNSQNNDVLSYSYDNITFSNFTNIKTNKLEVCASSPVYVKATRGNDTYYGYFYVNIEEFSSSSNEQYQQNSDLLSAFSNLFGNQDSSILENFSIFFNALKRSFIYKYLLLMILGAFILLIMKLIRR